MNEEVAVYNVSDEDDELDLIKLPDLENEVFDRTSDNFEEYGCEQHISDEVYEEKKEPACKSAYGKKEFTLPVKFFDSKRNLLLLSLCKPLSLLLVDCKKFPLHTSGNRSICNDNVVVKSEVVSVKEELPYEEGSFEIVVENENTNGLDSIVSCTKNVLILGSKSPKLLDKSEEIKQVNYTKQVITDSNNNNENVISDAKDYKKPIKTLHNDISLAVMNNNKISKEDIAKEKKDYQEVSVTRDVTFHVTSIKDPSENINKNQAQNHIGGNKVVKENMECDVEILKNKVILAKLDSRKDKTHSFPYGKHLNTLSNPINDHIKEKSIGKPHLNIKVNSVDQINKNLDLVLKLRKCGAVRSEIVSLINDYKKLRNELNDTQIHSTAPTAPTNYGIKTPKLCDGTQSSLTQSRQVLTHSPLSQPTQGKSSESEQSNLTGVDMNAPKSARLRPSTNTKNKLPPFTSISEYKTRTIYFSDDSETTSQAKQIQQTRRQTPPNFLQQPISNFHPLTFPVQQQKLQLHRQTPPNILQNEHYYQPIPNVYQAQDHQRIPQGRKQTPPILSQSQRDISQQILNYQYHQQISQVQQQTTQSQHQINPFPQQTPTTCQSRIQMPPNNTQVLNSIAQQSSYGHPQISNIQTQIPNAQPQTQRKTPPNLAQAQNTVSQSMLHDLQILQGQQQISHFQQQISQTRAQIPKSRKQPPPYQLPVVPKQISSVYSQINPMQELVSRPQIQTQAPQATRRTPPNMPQHTSNFYYPHMNAFPESALNPQQITQAQLQTHNNKQTPSYHYTQVPQVIPQSGYNHQENNSMAQKSYEFHNMSSYFTPTSSPFGSPPCYTSSVTGTSLPITHHPVPDNRSQSYPKIPHITTNSHNRIPNSYSKASLCEKYQHEYKKMLQTMYSQNPDLKNQHIFYNDSQNQPSNPVHPKCSEPQVQYNNGQCYQTVSNLLNNEAPNMKIAKRHNPDVLLSNVPEKVKRYSISSVQNNKELITILNQSHMSLHNIEECQKSRLLEVQKNNPDVIKIIDGTGSSFSNIQKATTNQSNVSDFINEPSHQSSLRSNNGHRNGLFDRSNNNQICLKEEIKKTEHPPKTSSEANNIPMTFCTLDVLKESITINTASNHSASNKHTAQYYDILNEADETINGLVESKKKKDEINAKDNNCTLWDTNINLSVRSTEFISLDPETNNLNHDKITFNTDSFLECMPNSNNTTQDQSLLSYNKMSDKGKLSVRSIRGEKELNSNKEILSTEKIESLSYGNRKSLVNKTVQITNEQYTHCETINSSFDETQNIDLECIPSILIKPPEHASEIQIHDSEINKKIQGENHLIKLSSKYEENVTLDSSDKTGQLTITETNTEQSRNNNTVSADTVINKKIQKQDLSNDNKSPDSNNVSNNGFSNDINRKTNNSVIPEISTPIMSKNKSNVNGLSSNNKKQNNFCVTDDKAIDSNDGVISIVLQNSVNRKKCVSTSNNASKKEAPSPESASDFICQNKSSHLTFKKDCKHLEDLSNKDLINFDSSISTELPQLPVNKPEYTREVNCNSSHGVLKSPITGQECINGIDHSNKLKDNDPNSKYSSMISELKNKIIVEVITDGIIDINNLTKRQTNNSKDMTKKDKISGKKNNYNQISTSSMKKFKRLLNTKPKQNTFIPKLLPSIKTKLTIGDLIKYKKGKHKPKQMKRILEVPISSSPKKYKPSPELYNLSPRENNNNIFDDDNKDKYKTNKKEKNAKDDLLHNLFNPESPTLLSSILNKTSSPVKTKKNVPNKTNEVRNTPPSKKSNKNNGYSPPILPIPSVRKTYKLLGLLEKHKKLSENISKSLNVVVDELDTLKMIENKTPEVNNKKGKKISLQQYKQKYMSCNILTENTLVEKESLSNESAYESEDLDYDSDATVILDS